MLRIWSTPFIVGWLGLYPHTERMTGGEGHAEETSYGYAGHPHRGEVGDDAFRGSKMEQYVW